MALMSLEDNWQEYVTQAWSASSSFSGYASEDECPSAVWARAQGTITVGEAMDRMSSDPMASPGWFMLFFYHARTFSSEGVREKSCQMAACYPIVAAQIYRHAKLAFAQFGQPDLSDAEKIILLKSFHSRYQSDGMSKLPRAESEIELAAGLGECYPTVL